MRLKIASRKSDLARLQAWEVGRSIESAFPSASIEYIYRESLGDQNLDQDLTQMPAKGVFTEDFVQGLCAGDFDIVVHSMKDLPTGLRQGTEVVATLARADARDLILFSEKALRALKPEDKLRILSSSPRRAHNLKDSLSPLLPFKHAGVEFLPVRGNIATRIRKLLKGEGDALVLAKAALDRLLGSPHSELQQAQVELRECLRLCRWMVLPLSINPSAAGQGALAVEVASSRPDLLEICQAINHESSWRQATEEREILSSFGGGCHQKIGISIQPHPLGEVRSLRGLTDRGQTLGSYELKPSVQPIYPKPMSEEEMFPRAGEESSFFRRKEIRSEHLLETMKYADLFMISRSSAWVEEFQPAQHQVLWVAGLTSWQKLAQKGLWVHGCSDSLGGGPPYLDALLGRPPRSLRLTHAGAVQGEGDLATYHLEAKSEVPDLRGRKYFYWMSGSSFRRALEMYPELKQAYHACGPGRSYLEISALLKEINALHIEPAVYPDLDSWRKDLLQ